MSLKEQGLKQYNAKNGTNYKMTSTAGTGGADTASPENAKSTSLKEQGLKQYNAKNGTSYKMTSTSKPSTSKPSTSKPSTSKPSTSVFTQKKTSASDKDSKKRQQLIDVYAGEYMSLGLGDKGLATQMAENRVAEEEKKQQEKEQKKYEKELKDIQTKDYNDNFSGRLKATYASGDLNEDVNVATSEYLSNPTEENRLKKERAENLRNAFYGNASVQTALSDENAADTWVGERAEELANYLPQFKNQQIAGVKGIATGAPAGAATGFALGNLTGVGAFLPEEVVTVPGGAFLGAKAGYSAGVAKYTYDTMRGAAYQQMIEAGVPEDIALEAANDEALISAMIEGGSSFLGLKFLGVDKLGRAIIGTAVKGVAKGAKGVAKGAAKKGAKGVAKGAAKKGATSAATKKALSILAGYGLNVAQEALEEGSQEVVSIANENRLKNGGDTGVLDLAGKAARQAFNLNDEEKARVGEAAKTGASIAAMMGAAGAATSNTLTYAVNKTQDAKLGSSVKASDMTSTVVNAALESTDEKTKAKATQIMQDLSSGKDVSNAKLGSLFKAVSKENTAKAEAQAKATAEVQDSPVVKAASTSDNTISKVFAQKQVENPTAKVATPTTENLMAQGVSTEKAVNIGDAITTAVEGGAVSNKQIDTIVSSSTAKAEFEAQTGVKLSSEKSKARKQIKEYTAQVAQQKAAKAEAAQAEVQRVAEQNVQQAKAQAQAQVRTQAEVQMMAEQNAQQAKAQAQAQMQAAKAQQKASTTQQERIMQYPEFARQMRETDPNATDMQIAVAYQNYRDSKTAETEASPDEIDAQHLRDFVEKVSAEYPDMTPQQLADAYRDYKADSTKQQETEEQTEARSQETKEQTEARSQETEEQTEARSQVTEEQTETKATKQNADVEYVAKKATEAFKKYGLKVETYYDSENKKQKGFVDGDTIHLNAAALKGRNAASYTLAHELMHPAIAADKTLAKDFLDVVKKSGIVTEAGIRSKIDKARPLYEAQAKKMGKTDLSFITDDYLREEVVCNLASDVFGDIGLLERVANQDAGFFAKMMTGVKRIIGTAKDAALKQDYQEIFDRMDKALKANKDNLVTEAEDGSPRFHIETYELGGKELLHNWLNAQKDLDAQTKKDIIEGMDKAYELATSLKGKYAAYDAWNEATVIEKDGKPVMSVIVNNGEYKLNIDFSTICKKRKHLDQVLNALVRTDGTALARASQEDIAEMNRIIKEHGFEIACGLCFVDAKRYRIAGWASSFTDMWNELADSVREAPVETLKILNKETGVEGVGQDLKALRANTKTKRHAKPDTENYDWTLIDRKIADEGTKPLQRDMAEYMKKHPEMVKHIDPEDLMASEGLDILKTEYPGVYKLLNTHQGTASPKISHSETPYNYEVLQSAKMTREEAESVGGVRIQSFSDYVANMFFDYVQLIGDLAAKRLPAQAYTKEADFVKLFGLTGIKINMSLVPAVKEVSDVDKLFLNSLLNDKGEIPASRKKTARFRKLSENAGLDDNGNYIWAKESFGENGGEEGFQLAVELQKKDGYRENIGTIAVGVSDAHILKLLADPNIRMVIPYHKSGINPAVALANNVVLFKDYTNYQNTRIIVGKKKTGTVLKFNAEGQAYIVVDKKKVFVKTKDGRDIPYFDFYKDLRESGDAKKTAQNYLDYCDEYGLIPKFDAFRDNPNYYKLLVDFNTYDAVTEEYTPQKPVELKLPEDFGDIVGQSLGKSQADADRFEAEKPAILDEIRKEVLYKEPEGRERFSLSEEEEDQAYMDAVNSGDTRTAEKMVAEAARRAGYDTPKLYHGTNRFGFTEFVPGVVFATPNKTMAAGYGKNWYADPREISNKYIPDDGSDETLIKNAKNLGGREYRAVTDEDVEAIQKEAYNTAKDLEAKINEAWWYGDNFPEVPEDVANAMSEYLSYPGEVVGALDYKFRYGDESPRYEELPNYERFEKNREVARAFFGELHKEFNKGGKCEENADLYKLIMGYDIGDFAIDTEYQLKKTENPDKYLLSSNGSLVEKEREREFIESVKDIGSYSLFGKLGEKPLVVEGNGGFWANLDCPELGLKGATTETIAKRAKEEGYTSVLFKNINDVAMNNYSANVKDDVYAFFDNTQLKSADPVTYDDNGNVIPLSERFNDQKSDIRFSLSEEEEDQANTTPLVKDSIAPKAESRELPEVDSSGVALSPQQREYFKDSKIVDKQGRLQRVYHNTNADFTIFDISRSGSNQGTALGQGVYLSKSKTAFASKDYGDRQMELYVNITNPFNFAESDGLTAAQADFVLEKYASKKHDLKAYGGVYADHAKSKLMSSTRMMDYIKQYAEENDIYTIDIFRDLGYDGIVDGSEIVAFSPEQIKLVTNLNPTSNEDIRFSLSEEEEAKVDAFMEKYRATKMENTALKAKAAREENAKLNEMIKRILAEDKHKAELKQTESDLKKAFKEKEAHNAKKAELEQAFAVDSVALGKDIGYQREMREQKRQYQEKIKENNRKAREDKLKAVAYEREVAKARVAVEKDKTAEAVAKEKVKGAEKVEKVKTTLRETKEDLKEVKLESTKGKKAKILIQKNKNKSSEVIAQSVEETYKQITGKDLEEAPKNVKTVWEDAKKVAAGTKASAREARAIFVRGTQELDVFDRVQRATKQTDIMPVNTGVKMVRAAANTCEYIHSKALVNAEGDIIGKALKDVVLCYDENGKYSQKDQNLFQMYLLAMHTVDRMSFKERAEQMVADFEAAHPGLAEMSSERFAQMATQTDAEEAKGKYPYTREVADQYIRLMDNAQKAKNKPVLKADDGTAVRADTAKTIAESLEAENPWLKDKAQELYDWYDTFMQEWVVGTRLSQEQYDVLKRLYPHYVPTYRVKEYESGKVSFTGRQGVSVADVMKRAKGGLSEVMPIEDSFYNLINGFVKQHRDAELRNAMYQSIEQNPEEFAGLGYIEPDEETETEGVVTDVEGSLDDATVEEIKDVGYKVNTWMNGEKKSMMVSKELYNSLRSLDGDAGPLSDEFKEKTKLIRKYVNLRKTLITGVNPFFGIRNVVRDLQSALIYTEGSPLHFHRLWLRAWREMASKSENWNNFCALGGLYSTRTRVEGGFAKEFGVGDPKGVKAIKKVPAALGKFNESSEAVTRFAEYLGTIERLGDSYEARQQGIRNASEITLDFGEAGRWGRDINQYVMYWNAQMQGVDKFVRQIKEKPKATLTRSAVLMSIPTVMCYALASFMDKEDEWDNIPSYVHDDYWVIFVNDEGDYIKVPKTREFGAVISMPLTRLLLSRDGVPDAWDNWSGTIKANFLPSEPISNLPFISTMSDLRANKNYRDVPIISSKFESITDRKDYEKVYNEKTSILAVKLGELFNMRPIYIDYVMKTEFGSMIAMALDAMAIGNVHNESLLDTVKYTADAAVGKLGIGNSTGYSRTISRFYDVVSETESNRAAKAVEITDEDELHKTPEWQINNAMSKYRSEMSDLSKAKRELIKQKMSKTEREAATAEINAQMEAVASAALDMYDAFKAGEIERPDLVYNYSSKGIEQDVMNALIDLDEYADADGVDFKLSTISARSLPASDKTSRVTYDISNNQGEYNKIFTDLYNESLSKAISSSEYRSATGAERAKILTDAKAQAKEEAETAMAAYMQSQGATAHIRSGINIDSNLEKELIKVSQVYKSTKSYFPRESAPATIAHPNSKYSKQYEMVLTDAEKEEYMQIYESTYNKYMTQAINSGKYKAMTTYNERRDYLHKVKSDVDDAVKEYYIKTLESRGRGYSKKQQ